MSSSIAPLSPIEDAQAAPTPKIDRQMTAAVVLAGVCTFLQIYVTQPLLPEFERVFQASALRVSFTVSAVTLAVAIASPLVGSLADFLGRKAVIVPAILGLAIPTALVATSRTLDQLIFWRFCQGLCVPGIIAVTIAYIGEESRPGTAGRRTAAYIGGTVLGGLLGRLFTAMCADHVGWRFAFAAMGAITFVCGLLVWKWLPPARRFNRASHPLQSTLAMLGHMRNPQLLATYLVGFNVLFALVGVFTYVNFYLAGEPFRLSTTALGLVFLVYALGVVVTPVSGWWIDRVGHRRMLVVSAAIVAVGALMTLSHSLPMVIAGLAVFSTGVFISQAAASSHVALAASGARSAATGLYASFYYLGGSVGATLLGMAWDRGRWPACIGVVLAAQALAATVAWMFFRRAVPGDLEDDMLASAPPMG
jgi:predicted MFS family arabinose efflux permease